MNAVASSYAATCFLGTASAGLLGFSRFDQRNDIASFPKPIGHASRDCGGDANRLMDTDEL